MDEIGIPSSQFPPGIRFHPSDEELISFYLERKMKSLPLPPNLITDIRLYSYDPWDLPRNTMFGVDECYFFTPRDRKYPNGGRPNRAAVSGYWKATRTDQPIRSSFGSRKIGVKKGLVFYKGKPPSGSRMDWIMTENRLPDTSCPSRSTGGSMRLDDWVLCRIRQKGNMSKNEIWDEQTSLSFSPQIRRKSPEHARDMLSDYLQSNEYNLIVSLLAGHDPTVLSTPTSMFPYCGNGNGSRGTDQDINSDSTQSNEQISYSSVQLTSDMINQSGPLVSTSDGRSYGKYAPEENKCKPNGYSLNGCTSFQELDQENFMQ